MEKPSAEARASSYAAADQPKYSGRSVQAIKAVVSVHTDTCASRFAKMAVTGPIRFIALVLESFSGPCPLGCEAAHLDGNPRNNVIANLMLVTPKENHSHKRLHGTLAAGERHGHAKLTENQVRAMRGLHEVGVSQSAIGRRMGIPLSNVNRIIRRKAWAHVS